MISNSKIKAYWQGIAKELSIETIRFVVDEDHLSKRLKGKEIQLGIVLPSISPNSENANNVQDVNVCMVFVLQKVDATGLSGEKEFDLFSTLQNKVREIRLHMINDSEDCESIMNGLIVSGIDIDPVYNFSGHYGYVLLFEINDTEL